MWQLTNALTQAETLILALVGGVCKIFLRRVFLRMCACRCFYCEREKWGVKSLSEFASSERRKMFKSIGTDVSTLVFHHLNAGLQYDGGGSVISAPRTALAHLSPPPQRSQQVQIPNLQRFEQQSWRNSTRNSIIVAHSCDFLKTFTLLWSLV